MGNKYIFAATERGREIEKDKEKRERNRERKRKEREIEKMLIIDIPPPPTVRAYFCNIGLLKLMKALPMTICNLNF